MINLGQYVNRMVRNSGKGLNSRVLRLLGQQSFGEYNYHRKTVLAEKTVLVEVGECHP